MPRYAPSLATRASAKKLGRKSSYGRIQATKAIDAWFQNLRERLAKALTVIDKAQQDRLNAVREAERKRIAEDARIALEKAQALAEQARKDSTPAVVEAAMEAEMDADAAAAQTETKATDLTRIRSASGITTSQSEHWTYNVTSLRELCIGIARGDVPVTFVTPNDSAIKDALKGKFGMRTCRGMEIYPDYRINRRGA